MRRRLRSPWAVRLIVQQALGVPPRMKSRGSARCQSARLNISTSITYQVVSQQLHDQCRVLVAFFAEGVELSNGIVESLLSQVARLVGRVEDLVVEDREVQGKTKADGVSGCEVSLSNFGRGLVGFQRFVGRLLALVGSSELSKVSVVVAFPGRKNQSVQKESGH